MKIKRTYQPNLNKDICVSCGKPVKELEGNYVHVTYNLSDAQYYHHKHQSRYAVLCNSTNCQVYNDTLI
jgi:hypothetical protein